jgi:repressor LexA
MKSRALRPTRGNGSAHPVALHSAPGFTKGSFGGLRQMEADLIDIPIIGRVAAGQLSEAIESPEDTVRVDRVLIGGAREVFGLRVNGESMINAGINNGDYVFVQKQIDAHKGDIIVALVGEEATCKYYYPESDRVRLVPANDNMQDIIISKHDWRSTQILGVVVGLYRRFN